MATLKTATPTMPTVIDGTDDEGRTQRQELVPLSAARVH
jgi:hypothetical protein